MTKLKYKFKIFQNIFNKKIFYCSVMKNSRRKQLEYAIKYREFHLRN